MNTADQVHTADVGVIAAAKRRSYSLPIPADLVTEIEAAGLIVYDHDDHLRVYRDRQEIGAVWGPAVEGHWFAKLVDQTAVRVPSRDAGLRHLLINPNI